MDISEIKNKVRIILAAGEGGVLVLDSGRPGPTVTICALTHANEVGGLNAVYDLFFVEGLKPELGKVQLILGNHEATMNWEKGDPVLGLRYLDKDFNRIWDFKTECRETARAREIIPYITNCQYLLDLHSTSLPSTPMIIPAVNPASLDFGKKLYGEYIINNILDYIEGETIINYSIKNSVVDSPVAVVVECGQHFEERASEIAKENIYRVLKLAGCIESYEPRDLGGIFLKSLEIFQVLRNKTPDHKFLYSESPSSFDSLSKGEIIARDGDEIIKAPQDCLIVMPTAQVLYVGQELGYLAKIVDMGSLPH